MSTRHVAIYPGSFDPVTYGHLDVIERGRRLFDEIVVGVGQNPSKPELFTAGERVEMLEALIEEVVGRDSSAAPVSTRCFGGLTVDFARRIGGTAILKGIRNLSDLQYEVQQAVTNREVAGLETVFIVAGQTFAYTSSSLIKQITALGDDLSGLSSMVPPLVVERLRAKKEARHPVLERLRSDGDSVSEPDAEAG
jgi:pantetheine-phosphate adenylyltransferase